MSEMSDFGSKNVRKKTFDVENISLKYRQYQRTKMSNLKIGAKNCTLQTFFGKVKFYWYITTQWSEVVFQLNVFRGNVVVP